MFHNPFTALSSLFSFTDWRPNKGPHKNVVTNLIKDLQYLVAKTEIFKLSPKVHLSLLRIKLLSCNLEGLKKK